MIIGSWRRARFSIDSSPQCLCLTYVPDAKNAKNDRQPETPSSPESQTCVPNEMPNGLIDNADRGMQVKACLRSFDSPDGTLFRMHPAPSGDLSPSSSSSARPASVEHVSEQIASPPMHSALDSLSPTIPVFDSSGIRFSFQIECLDVFLDCESNLYSSSHVHDSSLKPVYLTRDLGVTNSVGSHQSFFLSLSSSSCFSSFLPCVPEFFSDGALFSILSLWMNVRRRSRNLDRSSLSSFPWWTIWYDFDP